MKNFIVLLEELVFDKTGDRLSTLERDICQGTYLGHTYDRIAEKSGFSAIHVKIVGASLWEKLSQVFGEKVSKKNLRSVLERELDKQELTAQKKQPKITAPSEYNSQISSSPVLIGEKAINLETNVSQKLIPEESFFTKIPEEIPKINAKPQKIIALELPKGPLELESPFYISRRESEALSARVISTPGGLLRIKAPQKMGKTSLTIRIIQKATEKKYQAVYLDFQLADSPICQDLDRLLKWFCANVGQKLQLPHQIANYWDDILGYKMSCNSYFQDYLLAEISQPLVLVLDKIDYIFAYPEIAEDFFALLRAWYEEAKTIKIWKKLRLVLVYSTEVYLPLNINQSPFNVGVSLELPEFMPEQIRELCDRYQLTLTNEEIERLTATIGGHPYLLQIAFYYLKKEGISVEKFLKQVTHKNSPYTKHLQQLLDNLQQHSNLTSALENILEKNLPIEQLKYRDLFKLNSMGLVNFNDNQIQISCELYRQFFKERISQLI